MKTVLALMAMNLLLSPWSFADAANAPGVCTYDSSGSLDLQFATAGGDVEPCIYSSTGSMAGSGPSSARWTSVISETALHLYLNNQAIRNYSPSTIQLSSPYPNANSACSAEKSTSFDAYTDKLYAPLQKEMAADCAKLQAGGACVCLGVINE